MNNRGKPSAVKYNGQCNFMQKLYFRRLFDVFTKYYLFRLDPGGMRSLSLPGVLQTGLSFDDLYNDLTFEGISDGGGGPIGDPQIIVLPEPTSLLSLVFCFFFCLRGIRGRAN